MLACQMVSNQTVINMIDVAGDIQERGFTTAEFAISDHDRRRAAELGNQIIDMAFADDRIAEGLAYNISGKEGPAAYIGDLGVGKPRVADEPTRYFHSGWQSYEQMAATLPKHQWPKEVVEFFDVQREILKGNVMAWANMLTALRPDVSEQPGGLLDIMAHDDVMNNQHILRINRYYGLDGYSDENPTFSAHGDLSVVTSHLFETHTGHLRIAPYPVTKVSNDPLQVPARATEAQRIREEESQVVEIPVDEVALFLGFGSAFVADHTGTIPLREFNAAYHHGAPPEANEPIDDRVVADFGDGVRVSMVGFASPNTTVPYVQYQFTSKFAARPEMMHGKMLKALGVESSDTAHNPHG